MAAFMPSVRVGSAFAAGTPRKGAYSVVILGDTHFDAEPAEVYHSHYSEKVEWLNRVQRAEFARNGEMWRVRCPKMLTRAAANVRADTAFCLQLGDLIQGDCGNPDVHKKMLDDVLSRFKSELGGLPFVTVVGNHDIRGTGAEKAYAEYMPARMSEELGCSVKSNNFAFARGGDAWIVVDFNHPDVTAVDRLLDETKGARRTFVVSHGPVIPSDCQGTRWMFLGGAQKWQSDARLHFRARFAERNVIVLAGHTHSMELAHWEGAGGSLVQFIANRVWSKDGLAVPDFQSVGPLNYGQRQKHFKCRADGTPARDESAFLGEYKDGLRRYFRALAAGSYRLEVSDSAVTMRFYGGSSVEPTGIWRLA